MDAEFLMLRARFAYLSVLIVSLRLYSVGETHAIINVCALPPRESCNKRVSLESLYGICVVCFALLGSPKADITFPKASKPELIEMPSFARSPTAEVRLSY